MRRGPLEDEFHRISLFSDIQLTAATTAIFLRVLATAEGGDRPDNVNSSGVMDAKVVWSMRSLCQISKEGLEARHYASERVIC